MKQTKTRIIIAVMIVLSLFGCVYIIERIQEMLYPLEYGHLNILNMTILNRTGGDLNAE